MFFGILIFDPSRPFWKGYSPWKVAQFKNGVRCFFERFFSHNYFNVLVESISACFFKILIFDPNRPFWQGYSLCKMAEIKSYVISGVFGVFSSGFFTELHSCACKIDFCMFFEILIFEPNRPFWQGYSLCKMAEFKSDVISGVFGVFWSGFLHTTTLMCL